MKPKKLNFYINEYNTLTCYEKGLDLTNYTITWIGKDKFGNDKYIAGNMKSSKINTINYYDFDFHGVFNSLDKAKEGIQKHFNEYVSKYLKYFEEHINKYFEE